jgi:hypothetical protein
MYHSRFIPEEVVKPSHVLVKINTIRPLVCRIHTMTHIKTRSERVFTQTTY